MLENYTTSKHARKLVTETFHSRFSENSCKQKKKKRKKMTYNFLLKRGVSEVLDYLITLLSTQKTGNFDQNGPLYINCREFPQK